MLDAEDIQYHGDILHKTDDKGKALKHIKFLEKDGSSGAIRALVRRGMTNPEPGIYHNPESALRRIGDRAVYPLICLSEDTYNNGLTLRCFRILGNIGGEEARKHLFDFGLGHDNAMVVLQAARSLGEIDDDDLFEEVIEKTFSREHLAISSGVSTILRDKGDAAIKPVLNVMRDSIDWRVLAGCAKSLAWIGDKRALVPLMTMTGHNNAKVKSAAKQALKKIQKRLENA